MCILYKYTHTFNFTSLFLFCFFTNNCSKRLVIFSTLWIEYINKIIMIIKKLIPKYYFALMGIENNRKYEKYISNKLLIWFFLLRLFDYSLYMCIWKKKLDINRFKSNRAIWSIFTDLSIFLMLSNNNFNHLLDYYYYYFICIFLFKK